MLWSHPKFCRLVKSKNTKYQECCIKPYVVGHHYTSHSKFKFDIYEDRKKLCHLVENIMGLKK